MSEEEDPRVPMCGMPRTPAPVPPMENKIEAAPTEELPLQQPLVCIVCGFQPDCACGSGWQPYAATSFSAGSGHYGSTVWDTMSSSRSLEINVCDACLLKHKNRVAVAVRQPPAYPDANWLPWDPEQENW